MRIYVAGPITIGSFTGNLRLALDAAEELYRRGHYPYVPHLDYTQNIVYEKSWQQLLEMDLAWVAVCDAVFRCPGESKGADVEVAFATERGIPVYYNMDDIPVVERDLSIVKRYAA